jgi:hypothetical protein
MPLAQCAMIARPQTIRRPRHDAGLAIIPTGVDSGACRTRGGHREGSVKPGYWQVLVSLTRGCPNQHRYFYRGLDKSHNHIATNASIYLPHSEVLPWPPLSMQSEAADSLVRQKHNIHVLPPIGAPECIYHEVHLQIFQVYALQFSPR